MPSANSGFRQRGNVQTIDYLQISSSVSTDGMRMGF